VRQYALEYFSLPEDGTTVIADAVKYASETVKHTNQKFDYIVHDVFTGGAEPVELFTTEFLGDLHNLLKPNGAITIVSPLTL
jgi:spermidine synthase